MKRLIERSDFADAFGFGWRSIGTMLRQHAALYAAMGLVLSGFMAWVGAGATNLQFSPGAFITFPALAAAVRLAKPEYRMRFWTVIALLGITLLTFSPLIIAGVAIYAEAAIRGTANGTVQVSIPIVLLIFALVFVYMWVVVKFSASWAFYATRESEQDNITLAMRSSWQFVAGEMWWRFVGLAFVIGLICGLVPFILASTLLFSLGGMTSALAIFVWAFINFAAAVPATVWTQASYMALISTSIPQRERTAELDAAPA